MLEDVTKALAAIKKRGYFATRRFAGVESLRLEVKDVGPIRFPVSPATARKLCRVARQAGFGWRDKTLVDRDVRDTWELARTRLKIDQRQWKKTLDPQLACIQQELGLPADGKLKARLDKMLVYAPGQFFVPHQDSEKADNMVGTLTVVLPSAHKGGSTSIEHRGEKVTYRVSKRSAEQLTFIAFYADCHHEVRPIKEGYRVVLVYNLLFEGSALSSTGPDDTRSLDALVRHINAHFTTPRPDSGYLKEYAQPPDKLVYLLDHEYTQKSLGWHHLKNGDGPRAAALRAVAEQLDCEIYLALADVHETWSCEGDDDWGYRGWRYDSYDDADSDAESLDLIELVDDDIELRHWIDVAGKPVKHRAGGLSREEVCHTRASVEFDPFASEYEGWMGNYGNTVERWYHRAAVVLWPRSRSFAIRAKTSPVWAVDELWKRLKAGSLQEAEEKARSLLPSWRQCVPYESGKRFFTKTLRVAQALDDREMATALLSPFPLQALGAHAMPPFIALLEQHGITWCRDIFLQWAQHGNRYAAGADTEWLRFMPEFCRKLSASGDSAGRELARWAVTRQWSLLEEQCKAQLKDPAHPHALTALTTLGTQLVCLLEGAVASDDSELRDRILGFLTTGDTGYPVQCLVPALRESRQHYAPAQIMTLGLSALYHYCVTGLKASLAAPPRHAEDWSIVPPGTCTCALCGELARFLRDRNRVRYEWPLAKDGRRHVHNQLDAYQFPVTHNTRRVGRPYTLVLVKTRAVFTGEAERRRSQQRDLTWLNQQRRVFAESDAS